MNPSNERDREAKPASVSTKALDKQVGESLWQVHKAERGVWNEKMLRTLVRGVKGCGVDGITVNRFDKDSEERLLAVKEHLKGGTYQPKSVKRVRIPKAGSKETRPLGIPTVTDRVVQQAVRMVLEPIYEHRFADHSYGFRPGRSCHDALRRVSGQLAEGYTHVVDIDIQGYWSSGFASFVSSFVLGTIRSTKSGS